VFFSLIFLTVALVLMCFSKVSLPAVISNIGDDSEGPLTLVVPDSQIDNKTDKGTLGSSSSAIDVVVPEGMKVIALVFYGRRSRVRILECYIRRNLKENGGLLDEVHWVAHTKNGDDLLFLDEILEKSTSYKKIDDPVAEDGKSSYGTIWSTAERGNLYIKIDDDVVIPFPFPSKTCSNSDKIYVAPDAIERMIETKLKNPEKLIVSANVINSPLMGWVHYHMGAMKPYLPELPEASHQVGRNARWPPSWKASELPSYNGSENATFAPDDAPPSDPHRWLPLRGGNSALALHRTPVSKIDYAPLGTSWSSWAIDVRIHNSSSYYSFADESFRPKSTTHSLITCKYSADATGFPQTYRLLGKTIILTCT
jgi:hypothetical protein